MTKQAWCIKGSDGFMYIGTCRTFESDAWSAWEEANDPPDRRAWMQEGYRAVPVTVSEQNPEQHRAVPVAESQALPPEGSDDDVAIIQGCAVPVVQFTSLPSKFHQPTSPLAFFLVTLASCTCPAL